MKMQQQHRAHPIHYVLAAVFMVGMCALLVYGFVFRTDVAQSITRDPLSLLPHEQQNISEADAALINKVDDYQSQFVSDKLVFFVTAPTPEQTSAAVETLKNEWHQPDAPLKEVPMNAQESIDRLLEFYLPHQMQMVPPTQKQQLTNSTDAQLANDVMAAALRPVSMGVSTAQDPLGNLQNWFMQQAQKSPLQQNEQGEWQIEQNGVRYTVLFYQATHATFSLNTDHSVLAAYQAAKDRVQKNDSEVKVIAAGIPLHAAAAAEQANKEMNLFGGISMVGLVLIVFFGYKSVRAIGLIVLSLAFGLVLAFFATRAVFGEIHVVTLVFGTSLIGVAQDYGLHFIASRQKAPESSTWQVRRYVMWGLVLALITTMLAYACLGIAPFPGLRQIAVFSVAGLLGAWLTVVLLFPLFTHHLKKHSPLQERMSAWWMRYVQAPSRVSARWRWPLAGLMLVLLSTGWARLTMQDDLRAFQNSPQWLINEQALIGQALSESNTQHFIVTGQTEQALLENEEALRDTLDEQIKQKHLGGYRAVSEWLPSLKRQQEGERLSQSKLPVLKQHLGFEVPDSALNLGNYITPDAWLSQTFSSIAKSQWLGQQPDGRWASIVSLNGTLSPEAIAVFKNTQHQQPHVIWDDKISSYSQLMTNYRNKIIGLIVLAYVGTLAVLWTRYRRRAVFILLPPFMGSVVTLAILGWLGIPVQLFTVLPLLLMLGMGVDYGIFLVEHVKDQQKMWMTISLSAVSTILSLGMLVFSSTPALHTLGLCLGLGMLVTWFVSALIGKFLYQAKQVVQA